MAEEPSTPLTDEIARQIRLADATSLAGSAGGLLLGLGACLAVGIFVATFISLLFWRIFDSTLLPWSVWFVLYVLGLIGVIVWDERKFRIAYGQQQTDEANAFRRMMVWLLSVGPRKMVDGLRGVMGRHTPLQTAVLDRAVILVLDLLRAPGRVEIKNLIIPPEDMHILEQSINMLDSNAMIGKSTDGKAVWLISTFRDKLRQFHQGQSTGK